MEHSHEPGHAHQHHHHEGAKEQARGGDLFDPLLTLEEDLVEEGFQEGYTSGFVEGEAQGLYVGYKKGLQVGHELGYFLGCLRVFLASMVEDVNSREYKRCLRLKETIENFAFDAKRDTIAEEIDDIKSKFKLIASQVHFAKAYSSPFQSNTTPKSELSF